MGVPPQINDEELFKLAQSFSLLESEISYLVDFLSKLRSWQEDLERSPVQNQEQIRKIANLLDEQLSKKIQAINQLEADNPKVNMGKTLKPHLYVVDRFPKSAN